MLESAYYFTLKYSKITIWYFQVEGKSQNFPSDTCIMEKILILTTERRLTLNLQTEILNKIILKSNLENISSIEEKNSNGKVTKIEKK